LLIFVHGFVEHIARYTAVHTSFAQNGIAVFTFDQRGFGRTALDEQGGNGRTYGQTSRPAQFEDIEWAVAYGKKEVGEQVPTFLMGHSMGGGLALGYPTRLDNKSDVLCGVIATSPLILLAKPASKLARWIGGKASVLFPNVSIPANTNSEDLSHDPEVNEAYAKDPLIKQIGSLRGVSDMLNGGEHLLKADYQNWRPSLPLLLAHGTADKITSPTATQEFFEKVPATDKELTTFPDGFHELHNEPDGVKERLIQQCIRWIEARVGGDGGAKL
jgi:acylglycerol lipase